MLSLNWLRAEWGVVVAVSFSKHWSEEIADVTESEEHQTCSVDIIDPAKITTEYDPDTDTTTVTGDGSVYSGQARFIPIRAGIFTGGESQGNTSVIRSVRLQFPRGEGPLYCRKGLRVKITTAEFNPSLVGRWATVDNDYQGSSAATRTITANMDIDSGGPDGS